MRDLKLITTLIKNGIRHRCQKYAGTAGKPTAVSLEVTHHCIARCVMCNIWKIPRHAPNLSLADWCQLLSSDLFSELKELDITGGEPFLEADMADLLSKIREMKHGNLKSLGSIAITTNGFLTDRILGTIERVMPGFEAAEIDVVVVCAMDGMGEVHEQIRNYRDAWQKVDRTIQALKKQRIRYPNLIIGLKTTVLPQNTGELKAIARYAKKHGLFTIISPLIITPGRYRNTDLEKTLVFSKKNIEEMIAFYQSGRFEWRYHSDGLIRYFKTGVMRKPCSCGFNYFFIRSNGDLHLCPLLDACIGNVTEIQVMDLYYSKKASRTRRGVGGFPECRGCTEPGLTRYSLPHEGFAWLFQYLKMQRKDFFQLHHHMGFDKYLAV